MWILIARVWLDLNDRHIDLKDFVVRNDGSGILEGVNNANGRICLIKSWKFATVMPFEDKPVKIVEKKNPLKRDDA